MADPELRPQGAVEAVDGDHNGETNHVRGDLNLRIIRSLCRFVEETYGYRKTRFSELGSGYSRGAAPQLPGLDKP